MRTAHEKRIYRLRYRATLYRIAASEVTSGVLDPVALLAKAEQCERAAAELESTITVN